MHGTDVAYSAVYTQKLREELLKIDIPEESKKLSREQWTEEIRRVYLDAADGVIELQDRIRMYDRQSVILCCEKWNEIKAVLQDAPNSDDMMKYINNVGLNIDEFGKLYGKEKISDAILYAKDLKDRYSVLWLYYLLKGDNKG